MRGDLTIKKNLEKLSELQSITDAVTTAQLEETVRYLRGATPAQAAEFFVNAFSKSLLCGEFLCILSRLFDDGVSIEKIRKLCRVACTKNPIFFSAARELCSASDTLRILEESDFRACCEAVIGGMADYCILPLSSSKDGYYPTFSKLMKSYELKICKVASHYRQDSDEELRLALVSRELEINKGSKFISFSFTDGQTVLLSDVISALSHQGIRPISINSSPLEYNMEKFEHSVTAELAGFSPHALIRFLEAALPGYTLLGVY